MSETYPAHAAIIYQATPELRWLQYRPAERPPVLQQRWSVSRQDSDGAKRVTSEWRNIPLVLAED